LRRPGEVLGQARLLRAAWDPEYERRSNVVEVYLNYLREKIDRPYGLRSLETVRGAGLTGSARTAAHEPCADPAAAHHRLRRGDARDGRGRPARSSMCAFAPTSTIAVHEALATHAGAVSAMADAARHAALGRPPRSAGAARGRASRRSSPPTVALLDSTPGIRAATLRPSEVRRVGVSPVTLDRHLPARREAPWRLLALRTDGAHPRIVVAGQTLDDRDEMLASIARAFTFGGPVAVLLASLVGYALAAAGLAPIEADAPPGHAGLGHRSRGRLPLPRAQDEVRHLGETLNEHARPPAPVLRARAPLRRRRQPRGPHPHRRHQDRARGGGCTPATTVRRSATPSPLRRRSATDLAGVAEGLLVLARAGEDGLPVRCEELSGPAAAGRPARALPRPGRATRPAVHHRRGRGRRRLGGPAPPPPGAGQPDGTNALRYGQGDLRASCGASPAGRASRSPTTVPASRARSPSVPSSASTRGDPARTRGGAGLGCPSSRAIAEAHGGSAEIVSGRGGHGPAVAARSPAARRSAAGAGRNADGRRTVNECGAPASSFGHRRPSTRGPPASGKLCSTTHQVEVLDPGAAPDGEVAGVAGSAVRRRVDGDRRGRVRRIGLGGRDGAGHDAIEGAVQRAGGVAMIGGCRRWPRTAPVRARTPPRPWPVSESSAILRR